MKNKLCVITGANSGIGFETAKELASRGAYIVMVCRDEDKAEAAKRRIEESTTAAGVDIVLCDFAIQSDIRKAAEDISSRFDKIDVLINNHGFIASERTETVDGLESTFAVNHIGYFLFTNLLLDLLKNSGQARIINVASEAHRGGVFDPDNLQLTSGFTPWRAYANSKLFNILFTKELAERVQETGITVNCLHPGVVRSNFGRHGSWLFRLGWRIGSMFMVSNKKGAETSVYLAASDEVEGVNGAYFKNKKVAVPKKAARNAQNAKQLWEVSAQLCGLY